MMNREYNEEILEKCLPKYLEEDLKKLKDSKILSPVERQFRK